MYFYILSTAESKIKDIIYNKVKNINYLEINLTKEGQNFYMGKYKAVWDGGGRPEEI